MSTATIVVGIDGGPGSEAVLRFALEEATLRGARLIAATCWPVPEHLEESGARAIACSTHDGASVMLDKVIAAVTSRMDHTPMIVREVSLCSPGPALVHLASQAALLVLGSSPHTAIAPRSTRGVVEHCLRYAASPVTVVPDGVNARRLDAGPVLTGS